MRGGGFVKAPKVVGRSRRLDRRVIWRGRRLGRGLSVRERTAKLEKVSISRALALRAKLTSRFVVLILRPVSLPRANSQESEKKKRKKEERQKTSEEN